MYSNTCTFTYAKANTQVRLGSVRYTREIVYYMHLVQMQLHLQVQLHMQMQLHNQVHNEKCLKCSNFAKNLSAWNRMQ